MNIKSHINNYNNDTSSELLRFRQYNVTFLAHLEQQKTSVHPAMMHRRIGAFYNADALFEYPHHCERIGRD